MSAVGSEAAMALISFNVPANAEVVIYTVMAGLMDAPSLENPDRIKAVQNMIPYARDLTVDLPPYTVAVIEIVAK